MEFLRPKIIVKKDKEENYILKKKANISLILSLLILFFLIFKGLKRMENKYSSFFHIFPIFLCDLYIFFKRNF